MVTSVISAGDAANLGVQTTGGNDGVLVLRSGAAGAKVDALSIAAVGTATFVGEVAGVTAINSGQIGGRRNIVYNGEMKVAQRSASETGLGAASGYFTLDRWKADLGATAGRFTMAQVADGPSGFANCLKLTTTTADTSIAAGELFILSQKLEGQDLQQLKKGTSTAEQVTVSFYVKGNAAAVYVCEIYDLDNNRSITQSFAVTTSWNRIELTFAADTSDPLDDDNAGSFSVQWWLHAGATYAGGTFAVNTWNDVVQANRAAVSGFTSIFDSTSRTLFLTGVQMEIGATATDFESRSYGEELALCQRYYYQTVYGGSDTTIAHGTAGSATVAAQCGSTHPVTMRAIPTLAEAGTLTAYDGSANTDIALVTNSSSTTNVSFNCSASSLTLGRAVQILSNAAGDYLTVTAEL